MELYLVVPLLAAMALSTFAGASFLMAAELRANRVAALMLGVGAWWAGCELLWNSASDAETALLLHRIAAPGFCFIGPLGMLLVSDAAETSWRPNRWLFGAVFGSCFIAMLLCFFGVWMLARMEPVPWGYAMVPGPAFPIWVAITAYSIGQAVVWWMRDYQVSALALSRTEGPVLAQLIIPVAFLGIASDALLPILGIQFPRFATTALACFGATCVAGFSRYGSSRIHPRAFAMRALHTLPDGVVLTTLHGRIRVANERFGDLVGKPPAELREQQIGTHLDPHLIDPPRAQRGVECELRCADGTRIPVSVTTAPLGEVDGASAGVVLVVQDRREMASLRSRVAISGRLAAIGQLAAGIAHEINNPIAYVRANLSLLRREHDRVASEVGKRDADLAGDLEEWPYLLDEAIEGVDRISAIVRDVRELSHAGGIESELADVNQILEQVLRVARIQIDPAVTVETFYTDEAFVSCAPQRLKQVFLNLVVNASQAITPPGRIRVATHATRDWLDVAVSDDGCGMDSAVRERIFDPFFTTKPVGRGTGLGLSLAYEIVRSHGGEIWCESEPGAGSTFHVRIPRHRPEAEALRLDA